MPRQLEFDPSYAREVVDVPVATEMSESFLAYSLSVITSRAIPDVRDGLKPVQRRILWSMLQMGVRPGTPFRKSARIVGDTMGRYHPHGDSAIYDTLVRMGQDFSRMLPFIEPQGNFGSLDDPPAASRYTECRLAEVAMDMVRELDEDTVDFRTTYDGEGEEPAVLPAAVPSIIVNGTSGIAVGMATNMAPHNLREVAELVRLVMTKRRPKPTIDEMMTVLPGPDFPSGGTVVDDGLREAYETGRGSFRIRAKAHVEQITRSRQAVIVTELPYLVGPERVISKVQELANSGRLAGVAGIADLSDIDGLRIQIDLKPGINPQVALQDMYRLTPLEETFGVNNVVLVDGVPTTVGIYELCRLYIEHRLEVIVRRTQHRLTKAEDRLHILDGLLVALDSIDEVVGIIRGSQDAAEARVKLIERFLLTDIQAAHILDMPLRRLTALAKLELEEEATGLRINIADYHKLLGSETRRRTLVLKELDELADKHGVPRRAEIIDADSIVVHEQQTPDDKEPNSVDEPCVVTLSTSGNLGRAPTNGARRATVGRHDLIAARAMSTTRAEIMAVTTEGRAVAVRVQEVPDAAGRARGAPASVLLGLNRGETVLTLLTDGDERLVLVTANGVVKRLTLGEVLSTRSSATVISLKGADRVVAAFRAPLGVDIAMVASDGQVLRTPVDGINDQGRGASGVAGMRLLGGAEVVGADVLLGDGVALTVTSGGGVKATPYGDLLAKGRGGQGVRIARLADGETVTGTWFGPAAMTDVYALMADYDDPRKLDPNPVAFNIDPSARDLVPNRTERQIMVVGDARW
ncbi:MAG: DNA topoisomerase 4 subunit A [Acidimicrobiaceae bacterium]|nr:DNA topoisomerase 4 subunit A [Acidimicrobiaceae bacterium]MXW74539.1 DNA topoisomerase 4 subunit A [Acidimicrobiaceae bacterium]MYA73547.1 DNA topoisomerase 4 subunit A [Acidimicrobiaceae bacterium]MYC41483.1 DNA topoisomerase 4 subunit A [Acidimicrobiaceae bacterium]MYD06911.1 DNA topoisomerase 4 subunit A [Acidimicrobiaceae bacterium]